MTKIFAISSNVKEGDEKMKGMDGITVSPTTPQATLYPVTLPISSIVAKKKCGTSHLVIILLSLTIISLLYYIIPDLFYKRVHLLSNDATVTGLASQWTQRFAGFGVAEENTRVVPKLDSSIVPEKMSRVDQNGDMMQDMMQDNRAALNQERENVDEDGEMKQQPDIAPNSFETMKAIATLLKIPGVEQVAVVQNNDRLPDNVMVKPEFVPGDQPMLPNEVKEWELRNFRRAMREWMLHREMLRRRMLAQLQRERIEAAERKMARLVMQLQLKEQQEVPQFGRMQSMLPMFGWGRMQIAPPPVMWMSNVQPPMMEVNRNLQLMVPPMTGPRIPPMYHFMIPRLPQQELQQQQQPPAIVLPQMLGREAVVQPFGSNPGKLSATPFLTQDQTMNRLDMDQKKVPVPVADQSIPLTVEGTPDRDTIFKELRSRAQMQQQMSQTIVPAPMIPPSVPAQANSDEIFRELQHQALRMQIEQDRLETEQQTEKEKSGNAEVPVLMIADPSLPRQLVEAAAEQTLNEIAGATSSANNEATTKASDSGSSSESLSTFFKFLEKNFPENEITNSVDKEQETNVRSDDVKDGPERSDDEETLGSMQVIRNDEIESVVKLDEIGPQNNFVQEPATTEASASMVASIEPYTKLFKSSELSDKPTDANDNGSDMLDASVKLLEVH